MNSVHASWAIHRQLENYFYSIINEVEETPLRKRGRKWKNNVMKTSALPEQFNNRLQSSSKKNIFLYVGGWVNQIPNHSNLMDSRTIS